VLDVGAHHVAYPGEVEVTDAEQQGALLGTDVAVPGSDRGAVTCRVKTKNRDYWRWEMEREGRDLDLLTEKVEVEALGPQRLRAAVVAAIEDVLDLDVLQQTRDDESAQRERVREMRGQLGLDAS
jgi:hypothetical protein